ncbi:unnamed protein product, partial [Nesidiocoris tenuis]
MSDYSKEQIKKVMKKSSGPLCKSKVRVQTEKVNQDQPCSKRWKCYSAVQRRKAVEKMPVIPTVTAGMMTTTDAQKGLFEVISGGRNSISTPPRGLRHQHIAKEPLSKWWSYDVRRNSIREILICDSGTTRTNITCPK